MKKILALLLAVVMVIGLVACGEQAATPTQNQGGSDVATTTGAADELGFVPGELPLSTTKEKLVLGIMQNTKVLDYDDNYVTKTLEEMTGIDIEFMFFAPAQADARQQLALMVTHDVDEAIYMGTRVLVMDAHPGRVIADIKIDMPFPRDRSSREFVAYRNDILNKLHFAGMGAK